MSPEPHAPGADVDVVLVTFDSAADLPACFDHLERSQGPSLAVIVVDNASRDGSAEEARSWGCRQSAVSVRVLPQEENLGFAAAMNLGIGAGEAPYVLALNADARPAPDFVERLVMRMEAHPELRVAAVTGRLHRPAEADETRRLDACGMRLTRTWRHLDRGSGEADVGQYSKPEKVFGGTGAATLYRREALLDAAVEGDIFDPFFHSFREDAELCFRLRERGWEILYEPDARAEHRRFNLPQRRRSMPPEVNRHSLKNRYLLRLYHQSAGNLLRTFLPALFRDLMAFGYVLLFEPSSLGAYSWLWRHRGEVLRKRRLIRRRRTAPTAAVDRWFSREAEPL